MERNLSRARAYHQAGRAVVCVTLFGARVVKSVSAEDGSAETAGFETYSRLPVPLTCRPPSHKRGEERKPIAVEGIVDAHGILAYAGIAAEGEFRNRQASQKEPAAATKDNDAAPRSAGSESRENLAKTASSIGLERPAEHFYEEYWEEANRLLRASWEMVESLAEALLEHGTLNGRRVDSLVSGEDQP